MRPVPELRTGDIVEIKLVSFLRYLEAESLYVYASLEILIVFGFAGSSGEQKEVIYLQRHSDVEAKRRHTHYHSYPENHCWYWC